MSRLIPRRRRRLAAGVVAVSFLAACGGGGSAGGGDESGPIRIGVLSDLGSPAGESIVNAAELAAERINSDGGVHGRDFELVVRDTELNPQEAVAAYQRLGQSDQVAAAVGIRSSGSSFAIMDHLARVQVPFLNTGSATTELADMVSENYDDYKYWFRFMHNSAEIPESIMSFVSDHLQPTYGVERIAIFSEDATWTEEVRQIMRDHIEQDPNLELVAEELFDVQTTNFTPIFQRLLAADPDFIVEVSAHVNSAGYTKQWAALQPAPMGGVAVSQISSTFYDETDGAAAWLFGQHYGFPEVSVTDASADFYESYLAEFGEAPNYTGTYTYEAMMALADSFERMEPGEIGDADALIASLEDLDMTGVLGQWQFQEDHHPVFEGNREQSLMLVQWLPDNQRQVIWPEEVATGEYQPPTWWTGWGQ
ncbi:ABC transporter substrate-binding protein [Blastococcus sp. HT6-30]|uniref:ABC transporter substrate-binding protein n=1 Tax=Blastococcus sp. HT6-30 TaxID=3144843 RepID=UPI00321BEE3A